MWVNLKFLSLLLVSNFVFGAVLIDGIASSVGKSVQTVRDAYLHRALQQFWNDRYEGAPVETGDVLKKTVQRITFEEMILQEMSSLKVHVFSKAQVDEMLKSRKIKNKDATLQKIMARFGVKSKKKVMDQIWRFIEVDGYVQKRAETLAPIVLDVDIEKYYKEHKDQGVLSGKKLENIKPMVAQMIQEETVQKNFQEWIATLLRKYSPIYYLQ